MTDEEKNIDTIFREKLEGFQVNPPPGLWDEIQNNLIKQHKNRRLVIYRWIMVAAMLAIALFGGWFFNNRAEKGVVEFAREEAVIFEKDFDKSDKKEKAVLIEKDLIAKGELEIQRDIKEYVMTTGNLFEEELLQPVEEPSVTRINNIEVISVSEREKGVAEIENREAGNSFTEAEMSLIAENIKRYDKKESSWQLGMNISPGYSSYSANHNRDYASNMTYNATGGNGNISAGISVKHKTRGRWSVESGVYYVQNGQKTESLPQLFADYTVSGENTPLFKEGLYFNTDLNVEENSMVMNSVAGIVEFENFPKGAQIEATPERVGSYSNALITTGEFSQVFDFVEIPLYLRYLLIDSWIGLELTGGVNAGLVVGNSAYINNDYGFQKVGKIRDISTVNFSASVGFGITYLLSKHLSLALEPRVNYYINSINKSPDVNFRPYRIGLYSGIYYEF